MPDAGTLPADAQNQMMQARFPHLVQGSDAPVSLLAPAGEVPTPPLDERQVLGVDDRLAAADVLRRQGHAPATGALRVRIRRGVPSILREESLELGAGINLDAPAGFLKPARDQTLPLPPEERLVFNAKHR